jgi:hypothetical protein
MEMSYHFETSGGKDVITDFINTKVDKASDRAILTKILEDTNNHGITFLQSNIVYICPNSYKFDTESLTKNMKKAPRVFEVKYSDYRILYTYKGEIVYFLHIFHKKTNKCPIKELNKAIKRAREII